MENQGNPKPWQAFEKLAREVMSKEFKVNLEKPKRGDLGDLPKQFDMVSPDRKIVGDAKFLTLVNGIKSPPAKLMEIAAHVWMLQNVEGAEKCFLVFGNQIEVPAVWLKKYGKYAEGVDFYFIGKDKKAKLLEKPIT